MTQDFRSRTTKCPGCGRAVPTPEKKFNAWIRKQPDLGSHENAAALSIIDIDFCLHKFSVTDKSSGRKLARQHIMLVEHKAFGAAPPFPQKDTINAIDAMLRTAHLTVARVHKGAVTLFYHGFHVVRFPGTTPDDSEFIEWDGKRISAYQLKKLFRFELNAWTLKPREDRLHHRNHPVLVEEWLSA